MNIRIIAVSALLAGAFFSTAQAQDKREPTQTAVSLAGVDFSQPKSVKVLYGRLRRAAIWACDSKMDDPAVVAADRACTAQSLDRAVAQINKPALLALHAERTGQPASAPSLFALN